MTETLVQFQMTLSTAEDEAYLFASEISPIDWSGVSDDQDGLPEGRYRVINGQIYRIASGVPDDR